MNMAKRPVHKIDFSHYGAAIKTARTGQKESRNKVGNEMCLSPRDYEEKSVNNNLL